MKLKFICFSILSCIVSIAVGQNRSTVVESVNVIKTTPRLAVVDWGKYTKGTAAFGGNGTPRKFRIELAYAEEGDAIRKYENQVDWLSATSTVALPTFYGNNRFAFADLAPNTTYWCRVTATGFGTNQNEEVEIGRVKFTTPQEDLTNPNLVLYKDFDNFWFGGNPVYQAFAVMPVLGTQIKNNIDPTSEVVRATDYRTTHPMNTPGDIFTAGDMSPSNCPLLWNYYWEGDTYGTNYKEANYPGWQGNLVCLNTASVRLASAAVQGYIKTPKLSALGSTPTEIVVTINSMPYFESYQAWGEDKSQHFVLIEGPGEFVDAGPTGVEPDSTTVGYVFANSTKQQTVQMVANSSEADSKIPNEEFTTTTHTLKVAGATEETRIVIKTHPHPYLNPKGDGKNEGTLRARIIVDDIVVTKKTNTNIVDQTTDNFSLSSKEGKLFVTTQDSGRLSVYSLLGRMVFDKEVESGEYILSLDPSQLYIVKFQNKVVKVMLSH